MSCNSHFAQLVDVFNAHLAAVVERAEHEARALLGPIGRLEDFYLG